MVFDPIWKNILYAPAGEGDLEGTGADAGSAGDAGAEGADGGDTAGAGQKSGDAGGDKSAAPAWPSDGFPDDWADRILKSSGLNEDAAEKAKKFMERRKSPSEILKSALSADTRIEELTKEMKERVKPLTGKDDKPEDIEAWNKLLGVPKDASEYKVWEDKNTPWADDEKAIIEDILPVFHKAGMGQAAVDAALQAFNKVQSDSRRALQVQAMQVADATKENLRIEYGKAWESQIEMANRVASEVFGKYLPKEAGLHSFLSMPLAQGGVVGDYEPFVRGMIELGKMFGDHGSLETGMSDPKSLEQRRGEIHALQMKDPKAYAAAQEELIKITTALKRQGKVA